MRYVTVENLTEGMVLGRPFYGYLGSLLLQQGIALTDGMIGRLKELQFSGLYIEDELSEGIDIADIVSHEIRNNLTKAIHRLLTNIELNGGAHFYDDMHSLSKFLESLVDEIMSSDATIVNIIDVKEFDLYTYQHSVNVCVLCCVIGMVFELPRKKMFDLAMAAVMHDVGKVFVDKNLLNKPGKLTPEEFEVVKEHSAHGYNALKQKNISSTVTFPILQHHERFDGSGYPHGKSGSDIHLFAQIISVADVYDALTSKRPYHEPILPSEAYEYIMGNINQAFSWEIVEVFTKKVAPFPLGMQVQLSNGLLGIVYKNYADCLTRPLIRLTPTPESSEPGYIDLKNDDDAHNITIQKVFM